MPTVKTIYRDIKRDTAHCYCWACGRVQGEYVRGWDAPLFVERAHIVSSPRREDRRLIVLLDSICHGIRHGMRYVVDGQRIMLPPLTLANLLWLKQTFDPEYFDLAFLQRYSVQRLPEPVRLPELYGIEFRRRHPE